MSSSKYALVALLLLACVAFGQDTASGLPSVSDQTGRLFEQWVKANDESNWRDQAANASLLKTLMAQPDADVCFLQDIDSPRDIGDFRLNADEVALGKLNRRRTYDVLVGRLKSDTERWKAIRLLGAFDRPERVAILLDQLVNAPDLVSRQEAAWAMWRVNDSGVEPILIKVFMNDTGSVQMGVGRALAHMNSQAGLDATLKIVSKFDDEDAADLIAGYHRKAAVIALLNMLDKHWSPSTSEQDRTVQECLSQLNYVARVTRDALGPPPETPEEFRDWWTRADPLLSDDLQLKNPPAKQQKEYSNIDYGNSANDLTLRTRVDCATFLVGDPICLSLTMKNHSQRPYRVIPPNIPSGWWPTMAYGIRLKTGDAVLMDLQPSDIYLGSYSGPPPFETLEPGEIFKSSTCLQYLLRGSVNLPLPEGRYELTITFDSSKFAGVRPRGVELVHCWIAPPVKFAIKGPPRRDPQELIKLLGEKFGFPFILSDILSTQSERHDPAWQMIFNYGDSRLRPFVEAFQRDHGDRKYYFLDADSLEPYEMPRTH